MVRIVKVKENDVIRLNDMVRFRYSSMTKRSVDFDEDNEPIRFEDHIGGEQ